MFGLVGLIYSVGILSPSSFVGKNLFFEEMEWGGWVREGKGRHLSVSAQENSSSSDGIN